MTDTASPTAAAPAAPTAALIIIGNEILSGRTQDTNVRAVATRLSAMGIPLREIRIVPDEEDAIAAAVNTLRTTHTYLFTTGGIGPTHDDITADAVASAFGVALDVDERAVAELLKRHKREDLNAARLRMARIPHGAELIENVVSQAPGFHIGNVFVMAGVPNVMQAMMDKVAGKLKTGERILSETIPTGLPEGVVAGPLGEIADAHPGVMIGSYPRFENGAYSTHVVVRARDPQAVIRVKGLVEDMVAALSEPS